MLSSGEAKSSISDFLARYGERALLVLRIAYNIARDPNVDHRLGDFSYKHVVSKLMELGLVYNPANILRVMEREYGIIVKSYASKNQTWWRFRDLDAVREVLEEDILADSSEEPKLKLTMIKYRSLEPLSMLNFLRRLALKEKLNSAEKEIFRKLVFNELEKIAGILEEMKYHEEVFSSEIKILSEIIRLAEVVAGKLDARHAGRSTDSLRETVRARGVVSENDNR
ncbi:MAG: hypothetical protein OWQ48_05530 [Desulfurococcus sp.]|nr:hypothetical protein [Desulfurococcus sp.]